ncbi:hypothetical protein M0R45_017921 [Rubus argutus]|uniref:Uncharacterized protein n=1 Tax=Rubus argutus TaxID=59490 RepID=A0AAW1XXS4_RUBAR
MGMRTAAARLGLGLAAASARRDQKMMIKKISSSSFSQFMRRSTTLAAAADVSKMKRESKVKPKSESEMELNKEKTLYLCFSELLTRSGGFDFCTNVIRPIKLSDVLSTTTDEDDAAAAVELNIAAYKRSKLNLWYTNCSRLGSQILFAGGVRRKGPNVRSGPSIANREICWFETRDPNPKFEVSSPRKTKIKSFTTGKDEVHMGEVDSKLYCMAHNSRHPCEPFEVLDPTETDPKWRPLEAPPFINEVTCDGFSAAFVEGSNNILGWRRDESGVFAFDVTRPQKGWMESPSCLGNCLPFLAGAPSFIHHHHDPSDDGGGFQVMFTYDPDNAPQIVTVSLMSNNCDSLQPMSKPLQLPELPYEFQTDDLNDTSGTIFHFVNLGDQKVCLILYKFFYRRIVDSDFYWRNKEELRYNERNKGNLLLITFEYDIISNTVDSSNSKSRLDIQCRLLGTRRFQYFSKQLRKSVPIWTHDAYLSGAFLL